MHTHAHTLHTCAGLSAFHKHHGGLTSAQAESIAAAGLMQQSFGNGSTGGAANHKNSKDSSSSSMDASAGVRGLRLEKGTCWGMARGHRGPSG